ncbi:lytic transglycosylase domain-containing protein [uncultured Endozoicomonas sp.]|uniref:lytic transglycosylase domain-containing protein n=1 Tax=uncultured Endozoicomonas sp. TaxID=432652 RepID=UPI00260E3B81|nr:lytic transglycosylase domain-containing protein [uncultured Endozoicomonas sp.]
MILFNYLKTALTANQWLNASSRTLAGVLGLLAAVSTTNVASQPTLPPPSADSSEALLKDYEAQIWMVDMSNRLSRYIKEPDLRREVLELVYRESSRVDLPPELVLALIHTESAFDHFALSSAGAQGLMQVMPFWKVILGSKHDNLMNPKTNIRYGVAILDHYLEKEKGNLTRALARYNGSLGKTWYPERVYTNLERHWLTTQW